MPFGQVDGAEQPTGREIPDRRAPAVVGSDEQIPRPPGAGALDRIGPVRSFLGGIDGAVGRVDEQHPTVDLADDDRLRRRPQGVRAGTRASVRTAPTRRRPVMSNRTTPPSLPSVASVEPSADQFADSTRPPCTSCRSGSPLPSVRQMTTLA